MSFTNEELKRLKESLDSYGDMQQQCYRVGDFKALLQRLDAAERLAEHFKPKLNLMCRECDELLEAWRKSCGEAGVLAPFDEEKH